MGSRPNLFLHFSLGLFYGLHGRFGFLNEIRHSFASPQDVKIFICEKESNQIDQLMRRFREPRVELQSYFAARMQFSSNEA
jgi:hypothetical protein